MDDTGVVGGSEGLTDLRGQPERFVHGQGPYQMVDGSTIAMGWADLTDGSIGLGITITEEGFFAFDPVETWTNTAPDGTAISPDASCEGWTSGMALPTGAFGNSTETGAGWTQKDTTNCNTRLRLYCFEQ